MGYHGKTLFRFSDVLTLETARLKRGRKRKDEIDRVVFAREAEQNRRRLFRALCPKCGAWHSDVSPIRRGARNHAFECTSCGHKHTASEVRRGTEVK